MKDIKNLTFEELKTYFILQDEPEYRANEIFRAIYINKVKEFKEITTLPKSLREKLSNEFYIRGFKKVSTLGDTNKTQKFLFELKDKRLIETVLIKENTKKGKFRNTLCVSSQVGCAMGCKFCATGKMGFIRNLSAGEIIEQLLYIEDAEKIQNIVFMGMGEPLANYENVKKAIEIISDPRGRALGRRKIVVSTSGIIDKIYKLTNELKSVRLAVSLHSAFQEKRNFLMPGLKIYKIEDLMQAISYYTQKTGNTVTIEYLLIKDLNDGEEDAKQLIKLLRKIKFVKVNLIHYNPVPFADFESSKKEKLFFGILKRAGINTTIRFSKGSEISAACGQLATKESPINLNNL
ncbi:MAG: 23S rRNA (adenine(2503)-C(2))-methyltransferase RlmN [Caldisericaceae bacterium]|nr:23S rRNA (adenine(2503)-C(2))-methyltransferase RlmN [Caldisericaceae bacterium]